MFADETAASESCGSECVSVDNRNVCLFVCCTLVVYSL